MTFVTDDDKSFGVGDNLLDAEAVTWGVLEWLSDFSVRITHDELTLIGTHKDLAIGQPAVRGIVLRNMTVLFLSDCFHLVLQVVVLLHVILVGLVSSDEDDIGVDRAETDLSSNWVPRSMAHCLLRHAPLLVDLPNVHGLLWFGGERYKKLVVARAECH